ncbi:Extracellular matrix-binding ebh, putative [Babesia ovata]|uniref:Extracellular matrix-binding ebh, putative n=1 Tax=Babesia ovata TaxID=189622 RepID=A0A2H6KIH1_9APIC|nr:Extracellular matrix-binding ebh, putative [Babesia ovata]GBE62787.1 Extracellular matrix-binding ebh, putative [Babesia ovata]
MSNALGKLFDHVAQDAQKSLSSSSESDDPSAGDVISRLKEFRSSFPKDSANLNQNILHRLCSSVAKFVGYKPPGTYDGSGIVYGDACRLCDAIIEFLHSALSDVYENQPYVAGRAALSGVVGELGKARWRGHHGFKTAVPKVAGGLGEYNKKVKASNEKVRKPIDDVIAFVKDGGELSRGINDLQVSDTSTPSQDEQTVEAAASLVDRCKEVARDFSKKLESAKTAIGDLNPKLRSKLENARKSFFNHVGWLSKWSRKGQKKKLDEMIHKIKTRLRRLGKEVKDRIKQEVHALVELLKERVRKIKRKLEDISESLAKYVQDLVKWMDDAKLYINEVKKYVDKILEEIYGDDKKKIDEAAGKIDKTLSDKVSELKQWAEAADAAVQAAKEKAENVHGRLDHNKNDASGTVIGQGIGKIEEAKDKVKQVDGQLKRIHSDLGNWKNAASDVLGTAVKKATEVHGKLDPDKSKSTLGGKIGEIEDAKNNIISANSQLKTQVDSLHSWIDTAEDIRAKAERKAKEAYDKLEPHEALSKQIGEIVTANKKINEVHKSMQGVSKNLGEWKSEAGTVLDEAVKKATEVHDALDTDQKSDAVGHPVGYNIQQISTHNNLIKEANNTLATEVTALGSWHKAAQQIVSKAQHKSQEILDRVLKDNGDQTVIGENASKLKEKAENLLTAYSQAHGNVTGLVSKVTEAVKDLEAGMKDDLRRLQKDIVNSMKKHVGEMLLQIKGQVGQIKGKDRGDWGNSGASGLLGIEEAVHNYATAFRNNNFAEIAKGWLEATILRYNGTVRRILGKKDAYDE